ncbi:MAG: hypothetical protein AB7F31_03220 [Parachlamydiales bacterium]
MSGEQTKSRQALEATIARAIAKVKGSKENDLCKYLPAEDEGYMHHFTLRKMKSEEPKKLSEMIDQHILKVEKPMRLRHKPRRPRGTRKKHDVIALTRGELEQLMHHLSRVGDEGMLNKFSRRQSLAMIKKQLIAAIRKHQIDHDLWAAYVDTVKLHNPSADPHPTTPGQVMMTVHP